VEGEDQRKSGGSVSGTVDGAEPVAGVGGGVWSSCAMGATIRVSGCPVGGWVWNKVCGQGPNATYGKIRCRFHT
jgi:hypothetical protein